MKDDGEKRRTNCVCGRLTQTMDGASQNTDNSAAGGKKTKVVRGPWHIDCGQEIYKRYQCIGKEPDNQQDQTDKEQHINDTPIVKFETNERVINAQQRTRQFPKNFLRGLSGCSVNMYTAP